MVTDKVIKASKADYENHNNWRSCFMQFEIAVTGILRVKSPIN